MISTPGCSSRASADGTFPGDMLHGIRHAEVERVAHYAVKDRWLSESINYVTAARRST